MSGYWFRFRVGGVVGGEVVIPPHPRGREECGLCCEVGFGGRRRVEVETPRRRDALDSVVGANGGGGPVSVKLSQRQRRDGGWVT